MLWTPIKQSLETSKEMSAHRKTKKVGELIGDPNEGKNYPQPRLQNFIRRPKRRKELPAKLQNVWIRGNKFYSTTKMKPNKVLLSQCLFLIYQSINQRHQSSCYSRHQHLLGGLSFFLMRDWEKGMTGIVKEGREREK